MSKTREKVVSVLSKIGNIDKNGQIQNYNYRTMDDILNAVHPLFKEYGIFIAPSQVEYERENRMSSNRTQTFTVVKVTYKIYSSDDDDVITMQVLGESADMGDKSVGKAMTYAYKVLLQQLFAICTNEKEDPDAYIADDSDVFVTSAEFMAIKDKVNSAQTIDELMDIWEANVSLHDYPPFSNELARRKKELISKGE
jgi:hypothetical protein